MKIYTENDLRLSLVDHDRQSTFKHKRALCVCSAGQLRSVTMAWVLSNDPYNYNTRAVGTEPFALVPLDNVLLAWADVVFFAEKKHADAVFDAYGNLNKPWYVMNVADNYNYRDPDLVKLLETKFYNMNLVNL